MATEQAAARDRVLAARAEVDEELQVLEASTRAAVDIPAKIRRNPARAAAVVGGVGFLALRGPQRIVRGTRRPVFGAPKPMPIASSTCPSISARTPGLSRSEPPPSSL